jgi:putative ABC transport system ATP-binding protein
MLEVTGISKRYTTQRGVVSALDEVSLSVDSGELVALKGASGSGKTTLLLAAGAMLKPSAGTVTLDGQNLYALGGRARGIYRNDNIGFVFQMFHLIPYLSVIENVRLAGSNIQECEEIVERFGLSERTHHRPSELSAGERQRAAIARALVKRPKLVLADEPTGNLDPENATTVMQYLHDYAIDGGTVLVATHADVDDAYVSRTVYLSQGKVEQETSHV